MTRMPISLLIVIWGAMLSIVVFVITLMFTADPVGSNFAKQTSESRLPLSSLMGTDSNQSGFYRVEEGISLVFPQDHVAHPGFQNEWWYLTGNLQDKSNPQHRFGVQFTLFRFALAPKQESNILIEAEGESKSSEKNSVSVPKAKIPKNPWLEPQIYMAHFAITNADNTNPEKGEHRAGERFSRQGPGLAGARLINLEEGSNSEQVFKIWLADWRMQSHNDKDLFPMTIAASDPDQQMGLQLEASASKPMVLQGNKGVSLKNLEGGASFYYSYPRLSVDGELHWQGQQYAVEGKAWFDHEWSSNSLADYQLGWDWFSLQLDDGSDLMYYRFRNRDGSEGLSHFNLINASGQSLAVKPESIELKVLGHWFGADGTRYPSGWQLKVPEKELDLEIQPLIKDQLMDLSVRYWEGAVQVNGSHQGSGYVELSGYE